jgi:hypothetical protein
MFAATDIDTALSNGGIYLMRIGFMIGVILIMIGGYSMHSGNGTGALMSIVGGLIIACAVPFMKSFVTAAEMPDAAVNIGGYLPPFLI